MILSIPVPDRAAADEFIRRCGIKLSSAYRCFKHEMPTEILDFKSLGPKNYAITIQDKKDPEKVKQFVKVRGFSLNSTYASEEVTGSLMADYIDSMLKNRYKKQPVRQFRLCIDRKTRKIYTNIFLKQYANENACKKRVLIRGEDPVVYQTLPYGADEKMHARAVLEAEEQAKKADVL